ncbi:MAG: B12-binding domain-containing radical SAM protein [Magnetococcales bacterium]|nr:B12-binding domain-containing radical SAM protein [Magnetococcales bacterium]
MKFLLLREHSEIKGNISHGLGLIGTIAKEVATVKIIDNNSFYKTYSIKQLIEKIRLFEPDVIGFHIHTYNVHITRLLITEVRLIFPHICLIGGGLHAYYRPAEILEIGIHICAKEEADLTIIPLLRALQLANENPTDNFYVTPVLADKLKLISGLIFNQEGSKEYIDTGRPEFIKNLDELPFIDHDLFNLEDFILSPVDANHVSNTLLTQRGCPFSCSFCQGPDNSAYMMVREASPEYKIRYIEYLIEKHGHDRVNFYDANFTLNRKKAIAFCDLMIESGLNTKIKFTCSTNVAGKIDQQFAAKIEEAGCVVLSLGVERLDPESLQKIGKNKKFHLVMDNIKIWSKTNIQVDVNAMIGFPFETVETIKKEESSFAEILDLVDSIMAYIVIPIPGTKIYEETDKQRWYMQEPYASWDPPFYHTVYNHEGDAWKRNYFNLDKKTMRAILSMKERMYGRIIQKVNSPLLSFLFLLLQILAKISLAIFTVSPRLEKILFFPVRAVYTFLWKNMAEKYYN